MSQARKKTQKAVIKLLKDNNGKPLKVSIIYGYQQSEH